MLLEDNQSANLEYREDDHPDGLTHTLSAFYLLKKMRAISSKQNRSWKSSSIIQINRDLNCDREDKLSQFSENYHIRLEKVLGEREETGSIGTDTDFGNSWRQPIYMPFSLVSTNIFLQFENRQIKISFFYSSFPEKDLYYFYVIETSARV
ncbi:hypothetical protein RUM43_003957 [Polyplax serrata]|uniref:Uncharacterized protein n=1 Tax=Polyplax serrata TaxID=468196 RepID=A0AAN8PZ51_POLSC